jgi:outer membrane protein assembly factor BamA
VGELFRKLSKASEDENFDENYPKKMVEKDIENLRTLYMNIMYLEINLQIVEKFIM